MDVIEHFLSENSSQECGVETKALPSTPANQKKPKMPGDKQIQISTTPNNDRDRDFMETIVFSSNCSKCDQSFRMRNMEIYSLQTDINVLKVKIDDTETAKAAMVNSHKVELESFEEMKVEMEALKIMKENSEKSLLDKLVAVRDDLRTAKQANIANSKELEALRSQVAEKDRKICKDKGTNITLRRIARKFRDQKGQAEKKVAVLEVEKLKLEEEIAKKAGKLEEEIAKENSNRARMSPAHVDEEKLERIRELESEAEKLKEAVEKTKKESEAEMEKKVKKLEEGFAKKFKERLAENAKIIRAKEIETDQLNREAGKMKEEVKKKKTALEEAKKEKWQEAFKASLTQDGNEIQKQLEEKVERIRVLEIENLKEENKELHKAKDTTRANFEISCHLRFRVI